MELELKVQRSSTCFLLFMVISLRIPESGLLFFVSIIIFDLLSFYFFLKLLNCFESLLSEFFLTVPLILFGSNSNSDLRLPMSLCQISLHSCEIWATIMNHLGHYYIWFIWHFLLLPFQEIWCKLSEPSHVIVVGSFYLSSPCTLIALSKISCRISCCLLGLRGYICQEIIPCEKIGILINI